MSTTALVNDVLTAEGIYGTAEVGPVRGQTFDKVGP